MKIKNVIKSLYREKIRTLNWQILFFQRSHCLQVIYKKHWFEFVFQSFVSIVTMFPGSKRVCQTKIKNFLLFYSEVTSEKRKTSIQNSTARTKIFLVVSSPFGMGHLVAQSLVVSLNEFQMSPLSVSQTKCLVRTKQVVGKNTILSHSGIVWITILIDVKSIHVWLRAEMKPKNELKQKVWVGFTLKREMGLMVKVVCV